MELKLFVDDLRECPVGWQVARTVTDAIRILAQWDVEEVSLDHDIMDHFDKASKETFEPVARFIALLHDYRKSHGLEAVPKVRIHTSNPAGGLRMARILGIEYHNEMFDPRNY